MLLDIKQIITYVDGDPIWARVQDLLAVVVHEHQILHLPVNGAQHPAFYRPKIELPSL